MDLQWIIPGSVYITLSVCNCLARVVGSMKHVEVYLRAILVQITQSERRKTKHLFSSTLLWFSVGWPGGSQLANRICKSLSCICRHLKDSSGSHVCKSWTIKAEHWRTTVLEKTLESRLDKVIKPVSLKGNKSWVLIGRTDAEAEAPVL